MTSITRYRRWSGDKDFHFGPFITFCKADPHHKTWGIRLDSGGGDYPGCSLRFSVAGHTLIIELPPIIKPRRDCIGHYEGRAIHDEFPREYGFSYSNGFLQVFLGAQTHSSDTTQQWSKFLPWTQWRHVRKSWYDLKGRHFATESRANCWEAQKAVEEACPSAAFLFDDYDGQRITATTRIEEMEWHFGEGWFKWLALFRRPNVSRSLKIDFSAEVGPEKGSWKGGTTGHAIEMMPGELHEAAFRRYCSKTHRSKYRGFGITFVGSATKAPPLSEGGQVSEVTNAAPDAVVGVQQPAKGEQ